MEGIKYEFRDIDSVPMYDKEKETYDLMIDGVMVQVPAKLFHKLFRERAEESIFGLNRKSWPTEISQSYDDMKLSIRMWINGGKDVEEIKKMVNSYYKDLPKPVTGAINAVIDKIFEEEIKDKNKKD